MSYRFGHDRVAGNQDQNGSTQFVVNLTHANDQVLSGFVQDEMSLLVNKLWLTSGLRYPAQGKPVFNGQYLEIPFEFTNQRRGKTCGAR